MTAKKRRSIIRDLATTIARVTPAGQAPSQRALLARDAIWIAQEMGWPLADIAEHVGVKPTTVKMWRHLQSGPSPKSLSALWAVAWLAVADKFDRIVELLHGEEVQPLHQFVGQEIVMPRILRAASNFQEAFPERAGDLLARRAGEFVSGDSNIADSFSRFTSELANTGAPTPGLSFAFDRREEIASALGAYFRSVDPSTPELVHRRRERDVMLIAKKVRHLLPEVEDRAFEFLKGPGSAEDFQDEILGEIEKLSDPNIGDYREDNGQGKK